jgi:hypothetical protein
MRTLNERKETKDKKELMRYVLVTEATSIGSKRWEAIDQKSTGASNPVNSAVTGNF